MNIKDVSDLNKKWVKEYAISVEYPDGEINVNAGALGEILTWLNEHLACEFLSFRHEFDTIREYLSIANLNRLFSFYEKVEGDLLGSYAYIEEDCDIDFLVDKEALFERVMLIIDNMINYEILDFHKFLLDILAFE